MIKKKRRMSWVMALMMLLNVLLPLNSAYADDKTAVLTDTTITISQNGKEIGDSDKLTSEDPISVEISFGVPVEGDEPAPINPVKKGDIAIFELSNAFEMVSSPTIPLVDGSITVGEVNFATDGGTGMVTATVSFNGEDEVFNGGYHTVKCKFTAMLEYDTSGSSGSVGDHIITILGKSYTVTVPPAEINYSVTKSGTPDLANKSIEWTVDISAKQAGTDIDLADYQFYDDLAAVGTYISDSFKVNGVLKTPQMDGLGISYVFPPGSISPQEIIFKTDIPDSAYYAASEQKVSNKAQLLEEDEVVSEGEKEVKFTPEWIEKKGEASDSGSVGVYDPKNRTITWTITANHMEATLGNVIITDALPE